MKRKIDEKILAWKNDPDRKVLLLRGARQVGKTYAIRNLGKSFAHFLEVNFEEEPEVATFFEGSLNPDEIGTKLAAFFNVPVIGGKTLLFLDEIQACPNALKALRFFHEKRKDLHVVAAGSLLEFALEEIPSFGVGRISSLYMYPMSFLEYVLEIEGENLYSVLVNHDFSKPLDGALHRKLLNSLLNYLLIGGLPEVVQSYSAHKDLDRCMKILDDHLSTLRDDFAKYGKKIPLRIFNEVLESVAAQTGGKFKYSHVGESEPHYITKPALNLLNKAGLAHFVYHTAATGIPLGASVNRKKFKVLLYDVGIYQRMMGTVLRDYLVRDLPDLIHRGNLVELFVGLEFLASSGTTPNQLYYWHREARSANAEVDYVIQKGDKIVPVEVKSGGKGTMKSMHRFLMEKESEQGLRFSQENVTRYDKVISLPVYCAGLMEDLKYGDGRP